MEKGGEKSSILSTLSKGVNSTLQGCIKNSIGKLNHIFYAIKKNNHKKVRNVEVIYVQ